MAQRLAIIGAGPKGAAIAAKAAALKAAGHRPPPPHIDLYDPDEVGAAWRGSRGYTDGVQPLCTRAERDLGFPYDTATYGNYGPDVARAMLHDFSWQSFAINSWGRSRYRDWVVNGRHPPPHITFAAYLEYAVRKAESQRAVRLIRNKVSAVDFVNGMWRIESTDSSGGTTSNDYDGVVITGSGRPLAALPGAALPGANGRVFDGHTFWQPASRREMQRLLRVDPRDSSVLIIGAGGTAAAIAYWFVRNDLTFVPITFVGREATLFARHDGPFEDRLFTDDDAWEHLETHVRKAFLARTTAGVVWDNVLRNLVSDNIRYKSYDARSYRTGGPGEPELQLEMVAPPDPAPAKTSAPRWRRLPQALRALLGLRPLPVVIGPPAPRITRLPATVIIDARGFDRRGFVDDFFATSPLKAFFAAAGGQQIESDIAYDLSVCGTLAGGAPFPAGLHVPALGAMQGPASTNLMGLGWLADRVLSSYC